MFNKKPTDQKEREKLALKEIKTYKDNNYQKFRRIIPRYGLLTMNAVDARYFDKVMKIIKKEIKNEGLGIEGIEPRIHELFTEKYGTPVSQEEANERINQAKQQERIAKEIKLEQKFGVPFQNRLWFKCSIEEIRHSTFSNTNERDLMDCYIILEDTYMLVVKESMFLKSKMGNIKIFYDNIAGIDYDAQGLLNLSNSIDIHLKSSGKVQLKYVNDEMVNLINGKFNEYMENKTNYSNDDMGNKSNSNVDDLVKIAELYEKGLLTKEEFEIKKKELFNN
ncbi:hypothetical protein [Methanobrevibacter sp.]|uniref:hypothetical protein n=1 Tax=Methanobrevibacter sp. TaxID=66852 RepID=UPI0025F07938|nr:hypothetical protein [Methanobrevibacter sp.]